RPLTLPLPDAAVAVLRSIPRQALGRDGVVEVSPWVFPGVGKSGHLTEPWAAWERIRAAAELHDVRIHDLRRTVGSWLAGSGAGLPLIGRVLNHQTLQATAVYARLALDPVRNALDGHAERLLALESATPRAAAS